MKLQNNITVFAGDTQNHAQAQKAERDGSGQDGRNKTIYAGNFLTEFPLQDRIQQRKAQAQERALKIVSDAWDGDRQIDDEIGRSKDRIKELKEQYNKLREVKDALKSGQEKPEEGERAVSGAPEDPEGEIDILMSKLSKEIEMENAVIRGIRGERRKHHSMTDAQKQAEDVLAAARDEIVSLVVEEAKNHIDEEQEKREEQSEEIKEKKEEQEKILEERKEEEEELEEFMEDMPMEELADLKNVQEEIRQEVQNIVSKMNLVTEDIKGAMVDTSV